jgi:hypothetical protein
VRAIELEPTTAAAESVVEIRDAIDSVVSNGGPDWVDSRLIAPDSPMDRTAPAVVAPIDGLAILRALRALRNGDFRTRLPEGEPGLAGSVAEAFNDIVELNQRTTDELRRVSRAVGREGRIRHRASIGTAGGWGRSEAAVNQLVLDLTEPMLEVSRVLDAVARGDLSRRMPSEIDGTPLRGEYKRLAGTINTMVDQLNAFAS